MHKFFVNKDQINQNKVILKKEDELHLLKVLRAKTNDEIIVCDENQTNYLCFINFIDLKKNIVEIQVKHNIVINSEPNLKITLFQGLPKGEKMDLIIQKSVELGVNSIVPVVTKNTVSKPNNFSNKLERFNKISESASKQSNRNIIPEVTGCLNFEQVLDSVKQFDAFFICYEKQKGSLKSVIQNQNYKNIGVFIGPEGGFTEDEVQKIISFGGIPVTLGERILRTETAGFMFLALLLYENGEI